MPAKYVYKCDYNYFPQMHTVSSEVPNAVFMGTLLR